MGLPVSNQGHVSPNIVAFSEVFKVFVEHLNKCFAIALRRKLHNLRFSHINTFSVL